MESRDAPGRVASLVGWGSAYALYTLAYAGAIHAAFGFGPGMALLGGIANTLPEALAAPLVFRAASRDEASSRFVPALRLALLAVAFVSWSAAGTVLALNALKAWESGTWRFSLDTRSLAWKGLFSLLVFCALAGVGAARHQARRAREAAERALRSETLRAEARLAILRAQLNPHFILNVLHSLVGLAERDPQATARVLERLGTTLRYALRVQSRGSDRVTLREELAFTRDYLALERMRLGDRLETRFAVGDALLSRVVPPFVLQPLVENAVIHAIAPRARGGVLSVRAESEGETLVLQVEDDGSPDSDPASGAPRGSGLGLQLLRDRLDALYRGRSGLVVDRSPLGGVRATVRLVGEPAGGDEGGEE